MSTVGIYVGGAWRSREGREEIARLNPSTDDELGRLTWAREQDVLDALEAAQCAFAGWRVTPAVERSAPTSRPTGVSGLAMDRLVQPVRPTTTAGRPG